MRHVLAVCVSLNSLSSCSKSLSNLSLHVWNCLKNVILSNKSPNELNFLLVIYTFGSVQDTSIKQTHQMGSHLQMSVKRRNVSKRWNWIKLCHPQKRQGEQCIECSYNFVSFQLVSALEPLPIILQSEERCSSPLPYANETLLVVSNAAAHANQQAASENRFILFVCHFVFIMQCALQEFSLAYIYSVSFYLCLLQ